MKKNTVGLFVYMACLSVTANAQEQKNAVTTEIWEPQPRIVTPGKTAADAPSDAIVLFDGTHLNEFVSANDPNKPGGWDLKDGIMTVVRGAGDIKTKRTFGDIQLHIEWRAPLTVVGIGQGRGNSGIFLAERYEVQVLDNYDNKTYGNGQAGSIYKQYMPLVNACRKPGEWQTYDIIFIAPRFNKDGRVIEPAKVTVIHNGVLVQNNVHLLGPTEYIGLPMYKEHGMASIKLQDHGDRVSYRNIWVREL